LRTLLIEDPERGWRAFVDQYTPTILALIARAGVADRDDAADVYVRVCERVGERDCARLRRHDPAKGALAAWLTVLVRHVVVDWVRSRAGRRRLFRAVARMDAFDRRVFELFYWERRRATEIAELLQVERRRPADLPEVLDALERIDVAVSDSHRRQLLALVARTKPAASLDTDDLPAEVVQESRADPERAATARELDRLFAAALAALPAEDSAILRLTFVQGMSREDVRRALHLPHLTRDRLSAILARLRSVMAGMRLGPGDAATPGLTFLEGGS
jgi:DNA-directed RNA polymerase specialized sigma24 family protein